LESGRLRMNSYTKKFRNKISSIYVHVYRGLLYSIHTHDSPAACRYEILRKLINQQALCKGIQHQTVYFYWKVQSIAAYESIRQTLISLARVDNHRKRGQRDRAKRPRDPRKEAMFSVVRVSANVIEWI
jgi:hypothetical protein